MARLTRAEIFDPSEIVAEHLIGKTVRSCYLMRGDERTGKAATKPLEFSMKGCIKGTEGRSLGVTTLNPIPSSQAQRVTPSPPPSFPRAREGAEGGVRA